MQPGLALRSARSTAMRMLQSYGREHGSPRHKRALAAAVSSRTGLTGERIGTWCGLPVCTLYVGVCQTTGL